MQINSTKACNQRVKTQQKVSLHNVSFIPMGWTDFYGENSTITKYNLLIFMDK